MKNFRFLSLIPLVAVLLLTVNGFSQSVKNINSQPNIRPLPSTRFSALDGNGLIKNVLFSEMKDTIISPLQAQLNQKVSLTELSNSEFQLRNDLATKSELNTSQAAQDAAIAAKANTSDVFTKGQTNLNFLNKATYQNDLDASIASKTELAAQAAAQAVVDAGQNATLNLKADTLTTWKIGGNWSPTGVRHIGMKIPSFNQTNNWNSLFTTARYLNIGINPDSTVDHFSRLFVSSASFGFERNVSLMNSPLNGSSRMSRGFGNFQYNGVGALRFANSTVNNNSISNGYFGVDIAANESLGLVTLDTNSYGNGAMLNFTYNRRGNNTLDIRRRGIIFKDSLSQLKIDNYDLGFIVSDASVGKLAVRRSLTVPFNSLSNVPIQPDFKYLAFEEDIPKKTTVIKMRASGVSSFDYHDAFTVPDNLIGYTLISIKVDYVSGSAMPLSGSISRPPARGGLLTQNFSFTGTAPFRQTFAVNVPITTADNIFFLNTTGGATQDVHVTLVFEK